MKINHIFLFFLLTLIGACSDNSKKDYDLIIRNGLIYDGSGNAPISSDIAINGSFIALIGDLSNSTAEKEVNAEGMAVAEWQCRVYGAPVQEEVDAKVGRTKVQGSYRIT